MKKSWKKYRKKAKVDVSTDGLKIYTSLDRKAQDHLDDIINGDSVGFTKGMQSGCHLVIQKMVKSSYWRWT
ncbi:hypothetical protein ACEQPO_17165 [Bacillus sp. SL00103]